MKDFQQIYEKWTPQIFYNDLAKIKSILLSLIFKNLITIFKDHLSVDPSESCESWTVFCYIDVFGILKHADSKNTYFSEYLSLFTACFLLIF